MIAFTLITAPSPIGKKFCLDECGALQKQTLGEVTTGRYARQLVPHLTAFAEFLATVKNTQALTYGIFSQESGIFGTLRQKHTGGARVARCAADMRWASSAGILYLDYDPEEGTTPLTRDALVGVVRAACPFLADVEMLWRPSASGLIYHGEKELRGIKGQRLYLVVDNATQIPTIGKVIFDRLWLAGNGRFEISKSGAELPRSVVDAIVWQKERLDFVGGAVCVAPLSQAPLPTVLIPGERASLAPSQVPALTNSEQLELKEIRAALSNKKKPEAKRKRATYINEQAHALAGHDADQATLDEKKRTIKAAIDDRELLADFVLKHRDGERLTVAALLSEPQRWHAERFYDPIEPEYRSDDRICVAFLTGEDQRKPVLFSHAHGGRNYFLKGEVKPPTKPKDEKPAAMTRDDLVEKPAQFDKNGRPFVNLGNLVKVLAQHPAWSFTTEVGEVRQLLTRDALTGDIIIEKPSPWDTGTRARTWEESDTRALRIWFQDEFGVTVGGQLANDVAEAYADKQRVDRIIEHIEGLPAWDNTERLSTWAIRYLGCEDTPINRVFGRAFLIAMIARGLSEYGSKVDTVLTLVGGQGKRKSTAFEILAGHEDFFTDNIGADFHNKDSGLSLRGLWMVELGEVGQAGRSQLEVVKNFLSRKKDRAREAYARKDKNYQRRCVFTASTNNPEFLTDPTGNRRWWVMRITKMIDIDALRQDRDQLISEAREAYRAGEQFHLTEEQEVLAKEVQSAHVEQDPWHEMIETFVLDRDFVTVSEVLECLGIVMNKRGSQESKRVTRVLQSLGWDKKTKGVLGVQTRGWLSPRSLEIPDFSHTSNEADVCEKSALMYDPKVSNYHNNSENSTSRHQESGEKRGGGGHSPKGTTGGENGTTGGWG